MEKANRTGRFLPTHLVQREFLADIRDYKVVLVEKKGISGKPEINKLAELLIRNNVTVLGAVVR